MLRRLFVCLFEWIEGGVGGQENEWGGGGVITSPIFIVLCACLFVVITFAYLR